MQNTFTEILFSYKKLFLILTIALCFAQAAQAQNGFPYSDSFRNSTSTNTIFGNNGNVGLPIAFLTASSTAASANGMATPDAEGEGYLRLTPAVNTRSGFARNTTQFSSSEGLSISFEYYIHSGGGADGISFFLFDATASPFNIGGFGGSLGYAQNTTTGSPGVSKGYLGIGIDEFGNFSSTSENKQGGPGLRASSVTLRGDGNSTGPGTPVGSNYEFLTNIQTSSPTAMAAVNAGPAFTINSQVNPRAAPGGFLDASKNGFRKIRIELIPITTPANGHRVNIWITENSGSGPVTHHVITDYPYIPSSPVPPLLSYGFGASTGGVNNIHEIRTLDIVIPASVVKPPIAEPDVSATLQNTPVTFSVTPNDHDPNGNFQLNLATVDLDLTQAGVQTSKTVTNEGTFTYAVVGGVGQVTFTPEATFFGTSTIPYKISDTGLSIEGANPNAPAAATVSESAISANISVAVTQRPNITLTSSTAAVCLPQATVNLPYTATLLNPDRYSIDFNSAAEAQGFVDVTNAVLPASPIVITVPAAPAVGSYTGTLTVVNSASPTVVSEAQTITVTVNSTPATPTTSIVGGGSNTACANVGVPLTSNSASGNQWYRGGVLIAGATNQTYTATVSGVYTVIVTQNACPSAPSNGTSVTINPLPATPVSSVVGGASTTACVNVGVPLTSDAASGNQWYRDGVLIVGATSQTYTATVSGSYTVRVTDVNTCTSVASNAIAVTINPLPTTPVSSVVGGASTTACVNVGVPLTSDAASGNQWYRDGVLIVGATSQTYTATVSGSYTVRVTDVNTCTSVASNAIAVTINPLPTTPVSSVVGGASTTACVNVGVPLTSDAASGNQWYRDGVLIVGATSQTYTATVSGSYTVRVTDVNTCTSVASNAIAVTINPLPATPVSSVVGGASTTACVNVGVPLTSDAASGNQWYRDGVLIVGATSQTYTATVSGSYTVRVTDVNTCTSVASNAIAVTINPLPTTPVSSVVGGASTTACVNVGVPLTSDAASGNQWYRDGVLIVGATSQTYTATVSGSYTVRVTDVNTCTSVASNAIAVTINPLPTTPVSSVVGGASTTACVNVGVPLTSDAASGNQWYRDGVLIVGATSQTYTATSSGSYTVIRTTSNSCTSAASNAIAVTIDALPVVASISGPSSTTAGSTIQLTNSTTGGTWSSGTTSVATVNVSSGLVTGVSTGTSVITYTVTSGTCSVSVTKTITVTAASSGNTPPVVADVTKTGLKNTPVPFTASDFTSKFTDTDPLVKIKAVTLPSNGLLKINGINITVGQEVSVADLPNITFVPTTDFVGSTTFEWNGSDGVDYAAVPKNVNITISATNTLPIIADISKTGNKNTVVPFTANDFTSKFADNDPLAKIKVVTLPATGILKLNGTNVTAGQEIPAASLPNITFVPGTDFTGSLSFEWNGSDGISYASTAKNVNITILPVNTPPVAVADNYSTTKGGILTVSFPGVLTNDSDVDGNTIVSSKVSNPAHGSVTLNSNGSFIYTHDGGTSTSDSFTYKVSDGIVDGNTVTVTININTVNAPPVVSDLPKTGTGFQPIPFTQDDFKNKYNDPNNDALIKIKVLSLPSVGTLKLNSIPVTINQEIPVGNLGGLTFEPPLNWTGTTTFQWNGYDGTVYGNNPANVTLTVALAGDPTAKIGLAKHLASIIPASNASYDVKFIFTAINYGLNALENISLRDNLALAFGGTQVEVKSVLAFGNLKANISFNGLSTTELLLPTSKLSAGEEARVELIINVKLGTSGGIFQNTAVAEGISSLNGFKVTDISTNGLKPDPLTASDVTPSDATPIELDALPSYVPQGFSPNGDGQNDKFVIQNTNGKNVSLEIFNRWGNRIYKSNDYRNDWGGEVTEGFFLGRDIPDGTYYYIIIIDRKDKYTGFITINR